MTRDRQETLRIAALLVVTLLFGFVLLPLGIGLGYGSDGTGLSPRFMPQLATAGIVLALVIGLFQSVVGTAAVEIGAVGGSSQRHPLRALGAVAICMLFASVGFSLFGFYIGGALMGVVLTLLLGVRNVAGVLLFPVLIVAAIYLIFELGLQVRLPKSDWFSGVSL